MAKETMKAVSEAEKAANEKLTQAREECAKLVADAKAEGKKIIADAKRSATEKAEQLCCDAQRTAAEQKSKFAGDTNTRQDDMRKNAEAAMPRAAEEIRNIVLGKNERRQ